MLDSSAPATSGASGVARVLRGFAVLSGATLVSRLIGFGVLALVAREVGPGPFGAYNFALAMASYLVAVPSNFGIATLAIRDISRSPSEARRITGEALVLQAALALPCLLAMLALVPVLTDQADVRTLLPIVGIYYVVYTLTADWALQALQRMGEVALVRLAGQIVFGVITPFILVSGFAGVERYAWMMVVGAGITAVLSIALVVRSMGAPQLPGSTAVLVDRLKRSLPIGFSLVMVQVYYTIDQVLLGYLKDVEEVGLYAAATKIPFVLIGFSTLWATALYPHASRLVDRDPQALRRQIGTFVSLAVVVGLPLAVGASLMGDDVMAAVFGSAFGGAGTTFAVLVWATAVLFVAVNIAHVLLAAGEERLFAVAVTAGAVLNVVLNFLLIPPYGGVGSAVATLVAELAVLVITLYRFTMLFGRLPVETRRLAGTLAATAALAATVTALSDAPVWLRLLAAAVVYTVAVALLGVVRRSELALFMRRS